jgi:hypothetical protein
VKEVKWEYCNNTESAILQIAFEIEENRKILIKILDILEDYAGSQVEASRKLHSDLAVVK